MTRVLLHSSRCLLLDSVFLSGPFSCHLGSLLLGMREHADSLLVLSMMERQRCDIAAATAMASQSSLDEGVEENLRFVSERVLGSSSESSAAEDIVGSVMDYVRSLISTACDADAHALIPISLIPWL